MTSTMPPLRHTPGRAGAERLDRGAQEPNERPIPRGDQVPRTRKLSTR